MSRQIVAGFVALAAACAGASAVAAPLDPMKSADALVISRKIACSTVDGQAVTYFWHGEAYSRRAGEADRRLFDAWGMNIRACVTSPDGDGFNLVSRELLIYTDPATGKPLKTWNNPWTGESVDVLHVANDPVNGKYRSKTRDGKPYIWNGTISGGRWWQTTTVPLFYPNPLGGAYQPEVGGTYHATEMFNFFGDAASLLDPAKTSAEQVTVGWVRISDWLPWMRMGGREGVIYFHTAGRKLGSFEELPALLKNEIATHYPDYASPPPLDDARPNMTSWKYYDAVKKGDAAAPKR
ncbi:MAG: DUF1838 domain-containing protein [Parvularculaceae bacterium]|nr:DUF1838 domain-containing protein [Parvularculaceae bacterium]